MLKFLKSNLFFFLLLTSVVFSLYGKSINFDFTYRDDNVLILEPVNFLSDIKNIPKLFVTSAFYNHDFKYYRPILNLLFMFETSIFGVHTKIYHLTNIILFILTLWLMYVFLVKLKLNETILKFLILLISVHPILTSTVVWIPARNDSLLAIFIYLSFIFFINYLERKQLKDLFVYLMFFTFAMFTKESAILTMSLYFLFVWCFNYKLTKKEIIKNVCLFIPILSIYFCLRYISVSENSLAQYIINYNIYIKNFIIGIGLYVYELLIADNFAIMLYKIKLNLYQQIFVALSIFISFLFMYKKIVTKRIFLFCSLWFVLFLAPTFLLEDYVFFNHRIIVSMLSIVIMITIILQYFIEKYSLLKKYLLILFFLLVAVNIFNSYVQQEKYKNKYEYWSNTYSDAPNYHGGYYFVSRLYFEQGNFEKAKEFLTKANQYGNNRYLSDLALIFYYEGNLDKAEELYKQSIQNGVNKAQCYRNLSFVYLQRDNDMNKAMEYAKLAVKEDPYNNNHKQYLEELGKKQNENKNII